MGQEVVRELVALGCPVRLLVRHPERAGKFAHQKHVELFEGDVLKPETLRPAMVGVQAVIHLVGIWGFCRQTAMVGRDFRNG